MFNLELMFQQHYRHIGNILPFWYDILHHAYADMDSKNYMQILLKYMYFEIPNMYSLFGQLQHLDMNIVYWEEGL